MLNKAILIAAQAHLEQTDRAGKPYVLHPLRMMFRFSSEDKMIVAVLHDVVEDSPDWDCDRLRREGFSEEIVQAVDHISHRDDESYEQFIERVAQNKLARTVKIVDIEDNMNITRLDILTEADKDRLSVYHRAWLKLSALK